MQLARVGLSSVLHYHRYDYMPMGHKSQVRSQCKQFQRWVGSLEALVADLEKQRQVERETSMKLQEICRHHSTLSQAAPQLPE